MKRAALITISIIILVALPFLPIWEPIYALFSKYTNRNGNFSQLSVTSTDGIYEVFIDGESKGTVNNKSKQEFAQIKPGKRIVTLKRQSSVANFYYELERPLDFLPSAQVEIVWESGPTLESSSGIIKYFTNISKPNGAALYIQPFPQDAIVEFDSRKASGNVFEIFDTATHTLKVHNGDGFDTQSIPVNLTNSATKKVLTNIQLVIEIYLYKQPF